MLINNQHFFSGADISWMFKNTPNFYHFAIYSKHWNQKIKEVSNKFGASGNRDSGIRASGGLPVSYTRCPSDIVPPVSGGKISLGQPAFVLDMEYKPEIMATIRACCELSGYSNSSHTLRWRSLVGSGFSSSLIKPSPSLKANKHNFC